MTCAACDAIAAAAGEDDLLPMACDACQASASAPECDCHEVPTRHLDDDGHLPQCIKENQMTREDMICLAREAAAGINRPTYNTNPPTFDPHEWVIDAMALAVKAREARPLVSVHEFRPAEMSSTQIFERLVDLGVTPDGAADGVACAAAERGRIP